MKSLVLLFTTLFFSISAFSQVPKGDRILAWQVDLAESGNYDSSFLYAKQACMESLHLFYPWNDVEDSLGRFNSGFMDARLSPANVYYPAFGTKVELQLAPINSGTKTVPKDLKNVKFNDAKMISRFKVFLDTIFSRIPQVELSVLNIGNEHDARLGGDSMKYVEYKEFLDSVFPYARKLYAKNHAGNFKTGTTFTYHGLTSFPSAPFCWEVNNSCDVVSTTYYPLNNDFTMKDPTVVLPDFKVLVSIYSSLTKPIYFAECGYSSSTLCKSSEKKQADFYSNVFMAWDSLYDHIKYITLFKTNDWSSAQVEQIAPFYGLGKDTIFKEYLRTLGVRTWDGNGKSKMAYNTILCELESRSWCSVKCPITDIDELVNHQEVYLYPNPVIDHVIISNVNNIESVRVYNNLGELVLLSNYNKIDVENLPRGIYIMNIVTLDKSIKQIKFLKI